MGPYVLWLVENLRPPDVLLSWFAMGPYVLWLVENLQPPDVLLSWFAISDNPPLVLLDQEVIFIIIINHTPFVGYKYIFFFFHSLLLMIFLGDFISADIFPRQIYDFV